MHGEDAGGEGRGAERARERVQPEEQQRARERVQRDVRREEGAGVQAVPGVVEMQRQPGERDPVGLVARGEGALDGAQVERLSQIRVVDDVEVVVVGQELVTADAGVDEDHRRDQRGRDRKEADSRVGRRAARRSRAKAGSPSASDELARRSGSGGADHGVASVA